MDLFIIIFKKYVKRFVLFYTLLCTIYALWIALDNWIAFGTVLGSMLILLFFFLAIPAGIVEAVAKLIGISFAHPIRLADMDAFTACILVYVFNLVFSLILALIFSLLSFMWRRWSTKSGIGRFQPEK